MEQILLHISYGDFFCEYDIEKLNKDTITIGNSEKDDIYIESEQLKPKHVVIEKRLDTWIILVPLSRSLIHRDRKIDKKFLENSDDFIISNPKISSDSVSIVVWDKKLFTVEVSKYSLKEINEISIGSNPSNNIVYDNKLVSDYHATIKIMADGEFHVVAKSGCALHVNGRKCEEKLLKPGEIINVWRYKIGFDKTHITVFKIGGTVTVNNLKEIVSMELTYPLFQISPRLEPELPTEEISIPNPPGKSTKPNISFGFWLQLFLPPLLSTISIFAYPKSAMFMLPMAIGTVVISITNLITQSSTYKKREKLRTKKYMEIINKIDAELKSINDVQKSVSLKTHPDLFESKQMAIDKSRRLWERANDDADFLDTRLGIGETPLCVDIKYQDSELNLDEDSLLDEPKNLFDKYSIVKDIPVSVPLFEACTVGIVGIRSSVLNTLRAIILQIASRHSYDEVKIIMIFSSEEEEWNWVKWLPHIWDENRKNRFITCNGEIAHEMLLSLNDILKKRENEIINSANGSKQEGKFLPHYVVILADRQMTENEAIMKILTQNNSQLGVSTVFAYDRMEYLPKNCKYILEMGDDVGSLYEKKKASKKLNFLPDIISREDAEAFARALAPIRLKQIGAGLDIPNSISFLGLFDASSVEELNVNVKWANSETFKSLAVPLGVRDGGEKLLLDLHEKYHGPHGLIAGTTGSGKSELIQSFILSLAVNFHPHDVVFVLIDYKGGGMANLFEGMPHLVGTITNLDGNQITRSLISIKSEIKKRQAILGEFKVNHIDAYQSLYKKKMAPSPLPHLIIIIDEFAELKSEQPDFMRELVSAARVGRSLGVHLILATQKPSGVVDDQIWSNARFRLCLKVQDKSDSSEVLKRPDAANIKLPGRAYLQVGNNEMFELFQSAWSGAKYAPNDKNENTNKNEHSLFRIDLEGRKKPLFGYENTRKDIKGISQLEAVIAEVIDAAARENINKLNGPWLPPLPEILYLGDVTQKDYKQYDFNNWEEAEKWICPAIGLLDNPHQQVQIPATIDLGKEGHLLIYGSPGSGKTTLLSTLITSLAITYSPKDLNMYILDFGGRTFGIFSNLPHVGGVVMGDEDEKFAKLMKLLKKEIEKRKRLFSDVGVSSLTAYRYAVKDSEMPAIVVLLDNYSAMAELYPDAEETYSQLSREAGNYGIHLVITSSSTSAVKYKTSQNFKLSIVLQMTDKGDYNSIVGKTNGLEPSPVNGRGLIKVGIPLEFQTALPIVGENEAERSIELKNLFQKISDAWKGKKAKNIPILPDVLEYEELLQNDDIKAEMINNSDLIPLGLTTEDMDPILTDLNENNCFVIFGQVQSGRTNMLKSLIKSISSKSDLSNSYIVDSQNAGLYKLKSHVKESSYITDASTLAIAIEGITLELEKRKNEIIRKRMDSVEIFDDKSYISSLPKIFLFVDEYIDFIAIADDVIKSNIELILKKYKGLGFCMLIAGITDEVSANSYDSITKAIIECQNGVLLGGSFEQQRIFNSRLPYSEQSKILDMGEAYYLSKGRTNKIKVPFI